MTSQLLQTHLMHCQHSQWALQLLTAVLLAVPPVSHLFPTAYKQPEVLRGKCSDSQEVSTSATLHYLKTKHVANN